MNYLVNSSTSREQTNIPSKIAQVAEEEPSIPTQ